MRGRREWIAILVAGALTVAACASTSNKATPASPTTPTTGTTPTTPTTAAISTAPATSTTRPAVPAVPACNRPHAAGQFSQSFTFDGKPRTYQLYVPATYTGTRRVPAVFNFHGYGSNAVQQMAYANFKPLADRHDFLIVAPDGQDSATGRHFNLTNEPGLQSDLLMVGSLLDDVEAKLCVDTERLYSTGMSDGGGMTSALACVATDRFAAFAPVAVIYYSTGCAGKHPVAIEAFMGTADPIVPFNGGAVHCCGGIGLPSAPGAMAGWAAHDHCAKAFTDTRLGSQVRRRTWSGCEPSSAVVFYIVDGGGHTWPGSIALTRFGLTTQQIKATDLIWKFFSSRKLVN